MFRVCRMRRRKKYIFARKRRRDNGRTLLYAVMILTGLAIWSNLARDPQLPPIYLKAAPYQASVAQETFGSVIADRQITSGP